jgi:hypothetical protein
VWLAHFCPNRVGIWTWCASFQKGQNVAQIGIGESAGYFDGNKGLFGIGKSNKSRLV